MCSWRGAYLRTGTTLLLTLLYLVGYIIRRDYLIYLCLDGKVVLKLILKKQFLKTENGLNCQRMSQCYAILCYVTWREGISIAAE